jgi:hypothetical protein
MRAAVSCPGIRKPTIRSVQCVGRLLARRLTRWRYNTRVPSPQPHPDPASDSHKPHRHGIYATETVGLLLIATLLLVITLIRYWRYIHWSLR